MLTGVKVALRAEIKARKGERGERGGGEGVEGEGRGRREEEVEGQEKGVGGGKKEHTREPARKRV